MSKNEIKRILRLMEKYGEKRQHYGMNPTHEKWLEYDKAHKEMEKFLEKMLDK